MTKLKKNTHLSLSLSLTLSLLVDLSMHFDFPEMMCMYQSLSLSLSIYICKNVWIQIRPEWNSRKNVSSIYKFVHAIESMQSVVQKPMRAIKWIFSISQ